MVTHNTPGGKPAPGPMKRLAGLAHRCWKSPDSEHFRRKLMAELQSHSVAPDIVQCPNESENGIYCECRHFNVAARWARLPFVTPESRHPVLEIALTERGWWQAHWLGFEVCTIRLDRPASPYLTDLVATHDSSSFGIPVVVTPDLADSRQCWLVMIGRPIGNENRKRGAE